MDVTIILTAPLPYAQRSRRDLNVASMHNYGLHGLEAAPQAQLSQGKPVSARAGRVSVCASACLSVITTLAISDAFNFTQKNSLSRGYY